MPYTVIYLWLPALVSDPTGPQTSSKTFPPPVQAKEAAKHVVQEDETNGIFGITLCWTRSDLTEVNCSFISSICRSIITGTGPGQGRDGGCAEAASAERMQPGRLEALSPGSQPSGGIWASLSHQSMFWGVTLTVTSTGWAGRQRQSCEHSPPLFILPEMSQKAKLTSGKGTGKGLR